MRLRPRLALSHGLIVVWMVLVFPVALYAINRLANRADALMSADLNAIEAVDRIRQELDTRLAALMRSALTPPDPSAARDVTPQFPLHARIEEARPLFSEPGERAAFAEFERRYLHFENAVAIWQAGQMAQPPARELPAAVDDLHSSLLRLRDAKNAALWDAAKWTREYARNMLFLLFALGLLALLVGLLGTLRVMRGILEPVERLSGMVRRMSEGDFDIAYRGGSVDEFNRLERHFEAMAQALKRFRETNLDRLLMEQRRTDAVLDSIGDGLVIFSEVGRIERINAVAERQLGLRGQAIGLACEDVGDPGIGERVREVLAHGEPSGATDAEFEFDCDGDSRLLAYSLHRFVESESGRPGVVMVLRDVTAQREFDKMRSEFVMRASHELRTPITSIRMGLGLLGEKLAFPPGSRDAELYDTIQQELTRMVALLTDLLDLSRLRAGAHTMERVPTDIAGVLLDARTRFQLAAEQAKIVLDTQIEDDLPRLSLSRTAFDRVLDNLIGNALRHTPAGGGIKLSAHRADKCVAIEVEDTGPGIPYAQQALIFQPFVQVGNKRGGAGLGLAICKEIVQQHGGGIRVSSMPKQGTTFTIVLPA